MWEPDSGGGSSSNSHRGSRGIILLVSALSLCFLIYEVWGPLLLITSALVLVVHTCYSLLVNDSLLAPQTLVLLRYAKELTLEVVETLRALGNTSLRSLEQILGYIKRKYEEEKNRRLLREDLQVEEEMNGRRSNYRLSRDADLSDRKNPGSEGSFYPFTLNGACKTSTPLPMADWRKTSQQNGDLRLLTPISSIQSKKSIIPRSENKQPSLSVSHPEETLYSPKGSPWGNSISPKMSDSNFKTVQTIAGPLLTSTRYNIDPKVYTDVSSPGLTSRLTKYASEASNKLTHQPQYGTGQFPKVNLNAGSAPLLSPKVVRSRMPVTVRVAPPETINYSPSESHMQDKSNMFSTPSSTEAKETKSCPSVAQVLKVMSLKRHASIEDKMQDVVKKKRVEKSEGQLENLEEMMQKRARDESITSEDEFSPQPKTQRPLKRSKSSSCHDILNSLSSSLSVLSGVKRKAMDSSRCSTPDNEKHFKSSSRSPNRSSSLTSALQLLENSATSKEQLNVSVPIKTASGEPHQLKIQEKSPEVVKQQETSAETPKANTNIIVPKIHKEITGFFKPEKLTDKLFMKAEQRPNEKLKNLIKEQGNIEAKFATDDKDEIKKQDIVNMRQNSIEVRLKSMFEAISGKSASKIDPDVVIHAEELNPSASSSYTSLSSTTSTTTVNSSPIATTIVPILKTDTETKTPTTKHVTFNLPSSNSTLSTNSTISGVSSLPTIKEIKPVDSKSATSGTSGFGGFGTAVSSTPSFSFGSNTVSLSATKPASNSTTTTVAQSVASGFTIPSTFASITSTAVTSADSPSVKSATSNNPHISALLFAPKATTENTKSTVSVSSTGFSFGGTSNKLGTITATASAPAISFGTPATTNNTETSSNSTIPTFGNALSKSPASTSITQVTFGGEKKESGFSFGSVPSTTANSSTATTTAASQSLFGTSKASSMFSAGSNPTSTVTATPATTTSMFSFGSANKPANTGFSFGSSAVTTTASSTTNFGSVSAAAAPTTSFSTIGSTTVSTLSVPAFGAVSQNAISTTTPTFVPSSVPNTSTGTALTAPSASTFGTSTSLFGAPANSSSLFNTSTAASASMFKAPATTTAAAPAATSTSIFGSQSNATTFGSTGAAVTSSTPSPFGKDPSNPTNNSSVPSLFGNNTAVNSLPATTTLSAFGSSTTQQQSQGNLFSGSNSKTAAAPSVFGSSAAAPASTGLFSGNVNSSTSNMATSSADSTSIFGQTKAPASLPFGASAPTFGAPTSSSTFSVPNFNTTSGTSAFQMNATSSSSALPSFNAIKPTPQFGASTTTASSGTSIFGSPTAVFGSPATAPPAFGSAPASSNTSGGFGMSTNTAASSFGNPATGTSPFGTQPSLTAPTSNPFGSSTPATSGSSFSFGGTSQTQQQSSQQATPFSFGGATSNPSSGGVFQFGASNAPKPAGFNFNAPTAAPTMNFTGSAQPTFNAPTANMFSIGSGSSAPRSRTAKPRRQR